MDRASLYFFPGSATWVLCSTVDPLTPEPQLDQKGRLPVGCLFISGVRSDGGFAAAADWAAGSDEKGTLARTQKRRCSAVGSLSEYLAVGRMPER